jgi:hypothetical protein
MAATDADERFSLLEMDLPPTTIAAAPKAAPVAQKPAPTVTPLQEGRTALLAALSLTALDSAAHTIATKFPDASHPLRVELRPLYRALVVTFLWVRIWASVSRAVLARLGAEVMRALVLVMLVACVSTPPAKECGPKSDLDFCAYDGRLPGSCVGGTCYRQCENIAGVDTCPTGTTVSYTGDANFLCFCAGTP